MNFLYLLITTFLLEGHILLPIETKNRQDLSGIQLTQIGQFGLIRKSRSNVPEHYHTGIDIKRPNSNYVNEPIFPIAKGVVISKRTDGPFANLIIEHEIKGKKVWSLYEHIAGIQVNISDIVDPHTPIARFMNKEKLDRFGWQFDHFHFEMLKVKPMATKPTKELPERFYKSYSLVCFTKSDLNYYYYHPLEFFYLNR